MTTISSSENVMISMLNVDTMSTTTSSGGSMTIVTSVENITATHVIAVTITIPNDGMNTSKLAKCLYSKLYCKYVF